MFSSLQSFQPSGSCDVVGVLETLAGVSTRPRYAFMLLNLIAQAADQTGRAGPWIKRNGQLISLRDWLCDALTPMTQRGPRALALARRVRADLDREGLLPADQNAIERVVELEMQARVRTAGKSNLSRAVSELVRADLLRRHYQGYRIDHQNRGGHRHAVYTLIGDALRLLPIASNPSEPQVYAQLSLL